MRGRLGIVRACAILVLVGCYAPSPTMGVECGAGGVCPKPLVCSPATNTCETTATDAALPIDSRMIDAAVTCQTIMHDEDADGIDDACDNCPGIANANQADTTETPPDGVGDACDPRPTERDKIALFESFNSTPPGWTIDSVATIESDRLVQSITAGYGEAYSVTMSTDGALETRYTVTAVSPAPQLGSIEVVAEKSSTGVEGYRCMTMQGAGMRRIALQIFVDPYDVAYGPVDLPRFTVGQAAETLRFTYGDVMECRVSSSTEVVTATEPQVRTGVVGVGTQNTGAAFDYLVLYEPAL